MFDSLILAMLESALNSVAHFERTDFPTFQDSPSPEGAPSAVLLPAVAAHKSEAGCVVYTDSQTGAVLRVELPHPSTPDYDYCYAFLTGTTFNG